MKERYEIIKKLYPNHLILFKKKEKLTSIGIDKLIIKEFGLDNLKKVNKLILNNLDIELLEEYENNLYDLYYKKYKILEMIGSVK